MRPVKLTILILIALIAILILTLLVRENQHLVVEKNYLIKLDQKETKHLEKTGEFTKNHNDLQDRYNELDLKYNKLKAEKGVIEDFICTGYSANDPGQGTNNITAIGIDLNKNWTNYFNFAAVDPNVIPLGKIIQAKFEDGNIRYFLCVDTGGDIKGKRIDLYFTDKKDAIYFGRKEVEIRIFK